MALGSNNPFPSALFVEGTTPSSPSAGNQRLYVRSSDHVLCTVNSSGTVTPYSALPTQAHQMVTTAETLTGNNSWANLATTGPAGTVTIPASGIVKVTLVANMAVTGNAAGYIAMGFAISGANTVAAGAPYTIDWCYQNTGAQGQYGATWMLTGLTVGSTTFTAKYNQFGTAGTGHWAYRYLLVETLP